MIQIYEIILKKEKLFLGHNYSEKIMHKTSFVTDLKEFIHLFSSSVYIVKYSEITLKRKYFDKNLNVSYFNHRKYFKYLCQCSLIIHNLSL